MFYNDSLEPFATNGYISWSNLLNPKFPLMFVGCDGKEEDVSEVGTDLLCLGFTLNEAAVFWIISYRACVCPRVFAFDCITFQFRLLCAYCY